MEDFILSYTFIFINVLKVGRFIAVSTQHAEFILVLSFIHYCNISMQMTVNLLLPQPVFFLSSLTASFLSHLNLVYLLPVSSLHNPSSRVARRIQHV